jgi:hypothetical protein
MCLAAATVLAFYAAKPALHGQADTCLNLMEDMMKIKLMLPLLLVASAFVTPASANWFHNRGLASI